MINSNLAGWTFALKKTLLPALAVVWLLAVVPGIHYLLAFEGTAGRQDSAPGEWPAGVPEFGDPNAPAMVVALHPRCSCSAATLTELEDTFAETGPKVNTILLITQPRGANYPWHDVSLYKQAQEALHARVVLDDDGAYAARFGAQTSGEVLFYSAASDSQARRLLFAGGVTAGRGQPGENAGIELLKAAYHGRKRLSPASTPVFGCGLFGTHFASNGGSR